MIKLEKDFQFSFKFHEVYHNFLLDVDKMIAFIIPVHQVCRLIGYKNGTGHTEPLESNCCSNSYGNITQVKAIYFNPDPSFYLFL